MIIGIGTDITEISRIENLLENYDLTKLKRIYSEDEINLSNVKGIQRVQYFAGRYAAKEAFAKAIGTGIRNGIQLNQIEIVNNDLGKPDVKLLGNTREIVKQMFPNLRSIWVSISHGKEIVNAVVVLEE